MNARRTAGLVVAVQSTRAPTSGSCLSHSNQLIIFRFGNRVGIIGGENLLPPRLLDGQFVAGVVGGVDHRCRGLGDRYGLAVLAAVDGVEVRNGSVVAPGTVVGAGKLGGELAGAHIIADPCA